MWDHVRVQITRHFRHQALVISGDKDETLAMSWTDGRQAGFTKRAALPKASHGSLAGVADT
jgi:hypothetical protein